MTDTSFDLPLDCIIRPLKMTDLDLLSLSIMPTNPYRLPSWLSIKTALFLAKIGQGIVLASLPSIFLYLSILFMGGMGLSIQWVWILIVWFILLGLCICSIFINYGNWLKFYWVVELQDRFIAYAILRPFKHYSVLEALHVHPRWSRKGIGSALVSSLIQQVQVPIYVESAFRVKKFYRRLGFQTIRFRDMPADVQKQFFFKGRGFTALMVCH